MPTFLSTIKHMYPIVKGMLGEMCELEKKDTKEMGKDELGSWTRAVTFADGMWQTRGWHNAFSVHNYLNGALLYYKHLYQKGRDRVIQDKLYMGTSKSAEGFAARFTFTRARRVCKLLSPGKMQTRML